MQHHGCDYVTFLGLAAQTLRPRSFFEIGTNTGQSLRQFRCDAVCVDPVFQFELTATRDVTADRKRLFLFQMTSDDFFRDHDLRHFFPAGPDICFLDGLHLFETLLRDFINTERASHDRTVVFLHDCLPLNTRMAERAFRAGPQDEPGGQYGAWTGDVWRMLPILKRYRPDLRMFALDCPPTGLVAITRLDPSSRALHDNYYAIVDEYRRLELADYGLARLWDDLPVVETIKLFHPPFDLPALLSVT